MDNSEKNIDYNWAFYIDIEGFSNKFRSNKEGSLVAVFDFIKIIKTVFSKIEKINNVISLFAYQFGLDGFLIGQRKSYYGNDLKIPLACAISITRLFTFYNHVSRVQFSYGNMSSYNGSMDTEVIGEGFGKHYIKTIESYGDAIVNTYNLKAPKGPLFVIDACFEDFFIKQNIEYFKKSFIDRKNNRIEYLEIDWVNYSDNDIVDNFWKENSSNEQSIEKIKENIEKYINDNKSDLNAEWIENANNLLRNTHSH